MSEIVEEKTDLGKKNWQEIPFAWFLLAIAIGFGLRLILLNSMTFTQNELGLVNLAWQISQKMSTETSSVPVYTGLTGFLFFLFGAGNFLGRLAPAIVGASVVALPWLWKQEFGHKTALILSFALALDPTYLVFSRAIRGGIFAVAGLLWAFTLLKQNKPLLAGVSLAFAFLSGSSFWSFLFLFGLTILIARFFRPDLTKGRFTFNVKNGETAWVSLAAGFVISSILILTSFLLDPSGLGGVASGIVEFVKSFTQSFEKPIYHLIYLLLAHSLLPLLVYLLGLIMLRSTKQADWYQIGSISIVISLIIGLLISRESFEVLLLPVAICWIGGAIWLGQWQFKLSESWFLTILLMGFVVAILTYLSVNLGRLSQLTLGTPQFWNIFLMLIAGIILLISAWWLVRFGWSTGSGNQVFLLTFLGFLAITSLASSITGLHANQPVRSLEYLDNQLVLPNNDIETITNDFSLTGKTLQQWGGFDLIELPEEYSWYFRSFAISRNQPGSGLILTRSTSVPTQSDQFRGMNVVLERSIDWRKNSMKTYLQTFAGKTIPFEDQKGVLWVRTFLFTGASK